MYICIYVYVCVFMPLLWIFNYRLLLYFFFWNYFCCFHTFLIVFLVYFLWVMIMMVFLFYVVEVKRLLLLLFYYSLFWIKGFDDCGYRMIVNIAGSCILFYVFFSFLCGLVIYRINIIIF